MNNELINRIDMMMCEKVPLDEEAERTQNFDLYILLQDCRAALSRKYVPMTDDELQDVWIKSGDLNGTETMRMMESAVIRRAGLEIQE